MIRGNIYTHYKKKDYTFLGIAIPIDDGIQKVINLLALPSLIINETNTSNKGLPSLLVNDANTPDNEEIQQLQVYKLGNSFIVVSELPKVIYERDNVIWARNVDDFFDTIIEPDKSYKRFKPSF